MEGGGETEGVWVMKRACGLCCGRLGYVEGDSLMLSLFGWCQMEFGDAEGGQVMSRAVGYR